MSNTTLLQMLATLFGGCCLVFASFITGKAQRPTQRELGNTNFITLMSNHEKLMEKNQEILLLNVSQASTIALRDATVLQLTAQLTELAARVTALEKEVREHSTTIALRDDEIRLLKLQHQVDLNEIARLMNVVDQMGVENVAIGNVVAETQGALAERKKIGRERDDADKPNP